MQGRENTGPDRMMLELHRLLFPGTGYQSETGGLMKCLRSLTVEKIRQYHRSYYRPDNLCLVVVGQVEHQALMDAVAKVIRFTLL